MKTRPSPRARRGAATVEFALLAPLFVVLVFWSNYFWDVQRVKLKGAELVRYVAFERTVKSDVDRIAAEASERYKDLDGATKTGALHATFRDRLTLSVRARNADAPLTSSSLSGQGTGGLGSIASAAMSALGGTAGAVARQMGLDSRNGAVETDVEITIRNGFIPEQIALYTTGFGDGRLDLRMTDRFYLFHDTWRAWAPGDQPADSYARVEQHTHDRVRRIAYAGVTSGANGAMNAIGSVLSVLGLDFPFTSSYIRDSVLIRRVPDDGRYAAVTPTRTVPGDVLRAAYWLNDTRACFGNCEPADIRQKRGLTSKADYGDNWPMRAYNCRGPFFQGATKSEHPESIYSDETKIVKREQYHHYGDNACHK